VAFDRMICYEWSGKRSNVYFTFAANNGMPYFCIAYRDRNTDK
jgi:hypothetical protein